MALAKRVRRRTVGLLAVILVVAVGAALGWYLTRSPDLPRIAFVRSPFVDSDMQQQTDSGWEQAQRDHDIEAVTLTPVSDPTSEIDALAESGFDLIVVQQDLLGEVHDAAIAHPETKFVSFDNFNADMGLPNVTISYSPDVAAGTYLAGAAAALTTETGTIGYLGAHPAVNDPFRAGFEAGARAIDPGIEILSTYLVQTGSFDVFTQPTDGAALADDLYLAGADVVFHAAGGSGDLVPKVADELSDELGRHLWVIGVDIDQWLKVGAQQREHVLTSLLKRHDLQIEIMIDRYLAGELEAGTSPVTMADGIYALSTSGSYLSAESKLRLDALADELTRGSIAVSDVPTAAPTMLPPSDHTVRAEMRGDQCIVEQNEPIALGVLRLEFQNSTDGEGLLRLITGDLPSGGVPDDAWTALGLPARAGGDNAGVIFVSGNEPLTVVCNGFDFPQQVTQSLQVAG
jgi:basic membrane protein A